MLVFHILLQLNSVVFTEHMPFCSHRRRKSIWKLLFEIRQTFTLLLVGQTWRSLFSVLFTRKMICGVPTGCIRCSSDCQSGTLSDRSSDVTTSLSFDMVGFAMVGPAAAIALLLRCCYMSCMAGYTVIGQLSSSRNCHMSCMAGYTLTNQLPSSRYCHISCMVECTVTSRYRHLTWLVAW